MELPTRSNVAIHLLALRAGIGSAEISAICGQPFIPSDPSILALLDATGRLVRAGKGSIPSDLAPILQRLEIRTSYWRELICHYQEWFGHVVGKSQTVAVRARRSGRH